MTQNSTLPTTLQEAATLMSTDYRSPLLRRHGAVEVPSGPDVGLAWHYGDTLGEQRAALAGAGLIDRTNRDVLIVPGPDRLEWLHAICSQHVSNLADGESTEALVLSPNGHVEQHWVMTELRADEDDPTGGTVWIDTEPGAADEALGYLLKMRFLKRVEPAIVTADYAVLSLVGPQAAPILQAVGFPVPADRAIALMPKGFLRRAPRGGGFDLIVERAGVEAIAKRLVDYGAEPIGTWAAAALRVEARLPRLGFETDHRTIAHEVGWIGPAVHLDKGCYRGQETVARVQNLGKPPRRLVLLHLSGDSDQLPDPGAEVKLGDRTVGFVGTAVHHHELGPIALAVVKRSIEAGTSLTVEGQNVTVDD